MISPHQADHMRDRFFEQGQRVNSKIQAMNRELSDAGISDASQWRKALDLDTSLDGEEPLKVEVKRTETKEGKIENESWQRQLDVAFEQSDFATIQTLQIVRSDDSPNQELVRNKLNELITSRQNNWEETYRVIRKISTVEPDAEVVKAEFSKLFEKYGREKSKSIFDHLKTLVVTTGFIPPPEQIQLKYRAIIQEQKFSDFSELDRLFRQIRELTRVRPDTALITEIVERGDIIKAKKLSPLFNFEITSKLIQRAYERNFEKNGYLDISRISEIGEQPNPELVQRAYQKIIEKHDNRWKDSLKDLERATGIKPVFTAKQIEPVFSEFLQNGWYGRKGYDGIETLMELTGLRPPVDLVVKTALKIIDINVDSTYLDHGNRIKTSLTKFEESIDVPFEVPETEIQTRYKKAMTDNEANTISNLYGAFGFHPSVDQETARQFMLSYMSDPYQNPITDLEKVFNVTFFATDTEVEAAYDKQTTQIMETLSIDEYTVPTFVQIQRLTGKDWDREKVSAGFIRFLENKLSQPEHLRAAWEFKGDREFLSAWIERIKQFIEKLGVTIPHERTLQLYERLVGGDTVYTRNLEQLSQITGVALPPDLVQQAYIKIFSPDYVETVTLEKGGTCTYDRVSTLTHIFKMSGMKASVSDNLAQQFYRSHLESDSLSYIGRDIQQVATITDVKPAFDPKDINQLYKRWILDGREDYFRNAKEITQMTGVKLQLDEETAVYLSQQIEAGIEKVRSGDYKTKEHGKEIFDIYRLEQDLRKVGRFMMTTDVRPDPKMLQSVYSRILASDPYWATKIEQMVQYTGIKPVFSPEQLQAKGQQFLEQGSLRSFERLQTYGEFIFTPEVVAKTYDALLATHSRYNEDDDDWVFSIKRFWILTKITPTENQLAAIFSRLSQDARITQKKRDNDKVEETINYFRYYFGRELSARVVKDITISYLARGDVHSMKIFMEKVDVTPELTDEDLLPHVERLLEAGELNSLAYLKQEMKLARIPTSDTVVQSIYQHFVSQEDFGKEGSKSLQAFKQIFELTGVPAHLPAEQIDRVYKTTHFAEWQKLNEVIDSLPRTEVIQYKYLQFFTGGHNGLDKYIKAVYILTGQSPESETISKALEHFASEGKIQEMSNIVKIVGGKPTINPDFGQKAYRKTLEQFQSQHILGEKLVVAIDVLNDKLGVRPDSETMYQIYINTFYHLHYTNSYNDPEGKRVVPQFWEFLIKKFGNPDPEVVQRMYLAQLFQ